VLDGPGSSDEKMLQQWLERHAAFVPGYAGPRGMSGHQPWPSALISQPRLLGFSEKVPDFCWLSVDSAELTAMLVEIEVPSKRWHLKDGGQHAELTQARSQLNSWRAWFAKPRNAAGFLEDYLVPDSLRDLRFRQHRILVHGSRGEYVDSPTKTQLRASSVADDETLMSFDRLLELPKSDYGRYGCVRRKGDGFEAVAVPSTWDPDRLDADALRITQGYPRAIRELGFDPVEEAALLARLDPKRSTASPSGRWRPRAAGC
jgi:hypothetical protein